MNGRDSHDGGCHFHFQRARIHLAEPTELFLALIDIQLGYEVLVAGDHHHYQQPAHQGHVHQWQNHQNQIRFSDSKQIGDQVNHFLEELYRQRKQREGKPKVNGRQNPTRRIQHIFKKPFYTTATPYQIDVRKQQQHLFTVSVDNSVGSQLTSHPSP